MLHWLEQVASEVSPENDWFSAREQAQMAAMRIPKRRADWRLGRWTAKHAAAVYLNLPLNPESLSEIEIRPTEFGAPKVWLAGQLAAISISLSHRHGVAVCAVAQPGTMLGCDLELVEPRSDAFLADYFTPDEQKFVALSPAAERDKVANLFWSAKESALKALGMGLRLDSRSVSVRAVEGFSLPGDRSDRIASMPLAAASGADGWHAIHVDYTSGQVFQGWWQQTGSLLRTTVAYPAPEQPVPLTISHS